MEDGKNQMETSDASIRRSIKGWLWVIPVVVRDGVGVVELEKCIGCGLCVSGCPAGAARLVLKPKNEVVEPPKDMGEWSRLRKAARGLNSWMVLSLRIPIRPLEHHDTRR